MTGHDAQCKHCGGMTRWAMTSPATWPRCQWCGSPCLTAWCTDHDPQRRVEPSEDGGRIMWEHVALTLSTKDGETGEDAARRYVDCQPQDAVVAYREAGAYGFYPGVDPRNIIG